MDNESLAQELHNQRALLEQIYISAEKTRKYYLWTMIVTVIVIVLPLIASIFVIPYFLSTFNDLMGAGLGL